MILETAVQGDKVMQDFESGSFAMGVDHSQKVKATPIANDYGSKDCVNLSPSIAVFRFNISFVFAAAVFRAGNDIFFRKVLNGLVIC